MTSFFYPRSLLLFNNRGVWYSSCVEFVTYIEREFAYSQNIVTGLPELDEKRFLQISSGNIEKIEGIVRILRVAPLVSELTSVRLSRLAYSTI